jgi:branched-chain amino acid aminotransferase
MHDAVMLDSLGAVAECTGANLFLIAGETLVTPTTRAALPGITRRTVLELAAELGVEAVERDVWPAELHCADGAFVCGSGAGIVPVGSFDGRPVMHPEHPLVDRLREGYRARTRDTAYRTELSVALN